MKYLYIIFLIFLLLFSLSFGSDWKQVENFDNILYIAVNSEVRSISCADSNNCFALIQHTIDSDYGPVLYYSKDQGSTWEIIFNSDPFKEGKPVLLNARDGASPDPNHYFIAWWDIPAISKSNDGGHTFTKIILDSTDLNNRNLYEFTMYDSNNGFAITNGGLYFTYDGWVTFENRNLWDSVWLDPEAPLYLDSNTLATVTYFDKPGNRSYRFTKYHINEDKYDILFHFGYEPITGHFIHIVNLYFLNDTLGYACGFAKTGIGQTRNGLLFRTKDGGSNWNIVLKDSTKPNFGFNDIAFYDDKRGVLLGYYGKIFFTKDGGDTWFRSISKDMDEYEPEISYVTWAGKYPIIGTLDGIGIFRYEGDFFDFPISVKEILKSTDINIRQTPEKLLISIEDENFRKYKLQISDIMGNVVLEQELNSGIGTLFMPVDISGLTNGAYLYMMSTGGIIAKTGKIVVVR